MTLALECGVRFDREDAPADRLTVLRCLPPLVATKRWRSGDAAPIGYDDARTWHVEQREVRSLEDLAEQLEQLAGDPRAVVIRGEPLEGVIGTAGRRLVHDDRKTGDAARFRAAPRRWVALDFDKVPLDRAYDVARAADAHEALGRLRALLSPEWRRAACYGQLTASAGHGDPCRVSARLWFWTDRPVGRAELEAWAVTTRAPVDVAPFRAVQPIYTARPIFDPPLEDPIEARGIGLGGDPVVWLADYRPAAAPQPTSPPIVVRSAGRARHYAVTALRRETRDLAETPPGQRNERLVRAAYNLGQLVQPLGLDAPETREALAWACARWDRRDPRKDADTIDRGLRAGMRTPRDMRTLETRNG